MIISVFMATAHLMLLTLKAPVVRVILVTPATPTTANDYYETTMTMWLSRPSLLYYEDQADQAFNMSLLGVAVDSSRHTSPDPVKKAGARATVLLLPTSSTERGREVDSPATEEQPDNTHTAEPGPTQCPHFSCCCASLQLSVFLLPSGIQIEVTAASCVCCLFLHYYQ